MAFKTTRLLTVEHFFDSCFHCTHLHTHTHQFHPVFNDSYVRWWKWARAVNWLWCVLWKWIFGKSFMATVASSVMRSHRFISLEFISRANHRPLLFSPCTERQSRLQLIVIHFSSLSLHFLFICIFICSSFAPVWILFSHIIGVYIYFVNALFATRTIHSSSSATSYLLCPKCLCTQAIYNEVLHHRSHPANRVNTKPVQNYW